MSAAQTFRYARLRRSRPATKAETDDTQNDSSANAKSADTSLDDLAPAPRTSGAVQPLVVAGLAPSELVTVTTVSGASVGPLQLKERPPEEPPAVDPPVFL